MEIKESGLGGGWRPYLTCIVTVNALADHTRGQNNSRISAAPPFGRTWFHHCYDYPWMVDVHEARCSQVTNRR